MCLSIMVEKELHGIYLMKFEKHYIMSGLIIIITTNGMTKII